MSAFPIFRTWWQRFPLIGRIAGITLWGLWVAPGHAEGIIDIKPYVAGALTYDDNLFRVADRSQASSDVIQHLQAGVDTDIEISRQKLKIGLGADDARFNNHTFLDNTGYSGALAWYWQLGHSLNGELSASDNVSQSSFTELHNEVLNQRTTRRYVGRANWDLSRHWRVYVQRDSAELQNSVDIYRALDREDDANEGGIQFTGVPENTLTLSARDTESRYAHRDSFSTFFFGNANNQHEISADMQWHMASKTRLHGRLTSVSVEYKDLPQRNFSGYNEHLDIDWAATGKSTLRGSVWKEISGVDDLAATYVQSKGVSLTPLWQPTAKLTVSGRLSYENRAYLGQPQFILAGQAQRQDDIRLAGLTVTYMPYHKVQVQLAYAGEYRTSNTTAAGYRDNTLNASVRFEY